MTASRLAAMTANRTSKMKYGPQSTRAIWNAQTAGGVEEYPLRSLLRFLSMIGKGQAFASGS